MLRDDWRFIYPASTVGEAAGRLAEYHRERLWSWEEAKAQAEERISDKGVEVRHHEVTGGQRAEVVIDPSLAARLQECEGKISTHKRAAQVYAEWSAVMERAADGPMTLDIDDVRFFELVEVGAEAETP